MSERSVVELPPEVGEPFEVFLNGVPQRAGRDFRVEGRQLVFERSLAREGRLGFWRWLSLFLGIAGTYRQNDSVDVVHDIAGTAHRHEPGDRAAVDGPVRLTERKSRAASDRNRRRQGRNLLEPARRPGRPARPD